MLPPLPLLRPGGWDVGQAPIIFPRPGQVAQLVEQGTENPRVGGSIPSLAIRYKCSWRSLRRSILRLSSISARPIVNPTCPSHTATWFTRAGPP